MTGRLDQADSHIVREVRGCVAADADPPRVAAGEQSRAEAAARAVVASVACDEAGSLEVHLLVETAPRLGVGLTALRHARRRGRTILAARNLTTAGVLVRSRGPAGAPRS